MRRTAQVVGVAVLLSGVGVAADPPAPQPPQTAEAKAARAKYEEELTKAREKLDQATAAARKAYLEELTTAQKTATKAAQLDEAVRIRDLKAAVEQEQDTGAKPGREGAVSLKGSQFKIVLAEGSWTAAREACQKLGGDLAVLDTKEKRELIAGLNGSLELFVGAAKDKNGKWKWVNGQAVEADAWEKGRPENFGGFTVVFPKVGTLGDCGDGHRPKGFVCEWKK